jgi:hypothetical protein
MVNLSLVFVVLVGAQTRLAPSPKVAPRATASVAAPVGRAMPAPPRLAPTVLPRLAPIPNAPKVAPKASPKATLSVVEQASARLAVATQNNKDLEPVLKNLYREMALPVSETSVPAPKLSFEEFGRAAEKAWNGAVVGRTSKPRAQPEGVLPDPGEMKRRMELPTLSNPQREANIVEIFKMGGWGPKVVKLKPGEAPNLDDTTGTIWQQDAGRGRHNYFVVKPGKNPNKIIVTGGHHDKVDVGEGKIDNWTGATMIANLSQEKHGTETEATHVFVAFAREEEGLLGSQFFVNSLTKTQRGRIKAMVNLDTMAVDGTFSWKNNSSRWMLDLIAKVAKTKGLDLKEMHLDGGDSDSSTFREFAQSMTLFGASPDVIWDILHSENDTMKPFVLEHYVNAAKLALELINALDAADIPPVTRRNLVARLASKLQARAPHPYQVEMARRRASKN